MREPKKEEVTPARITLQFREASNMTYELDCQGVALVLRIFFPTGTDAGAWRIVAQASTAPDSPSTASTAASRLEALRALARSCNDGGGLPAFARIDWSAVERAMASVRAV
jgi:hypothetical protein